VAGVLLLGPWPLRDSRWVSLAWPGPTSLADAQNFCYPQLAATLVLLVVLGALCGTTPLSRAPSRARLVARLATLMVATALLITTHPLTGMALATALAALGVNWLLRREATVSRLVLLAAIPLGGFLIGLAWPYYPLAGLLRALASRASATPSPSRSRSWGRPARPCFRPRDRRETCSRSAPSSDRRPSASWAACSSPANGVRCSCSGS